MSADEGRNEIESGFVGGAAAAADRPRHLVVQTAFVGDLLLAIPLLKEIRARDPGAEIWLLCRKGLGDFAERAGLVDRAIEVDKGAGRDGWMAARAALLATAFDHVYCPHQSPRTALFVARLKASRKIGFRSFWNAAFFDERVERPMRLPDALRQLALLAPEDPELAARLKTYEREHAPGGLPLSADLGALSLHPHAGDRGPEARPRRESLRLQAPPEWAAMTVPRLQQTRSRASQPMAVVAELAKDLGIGAGKPTAFLAPGSVWPTKRWRPAGFAEVARSLMARGWNVVFFGAPAELALAEQAQKAAPGSRMAIGAPISFFESCELLALGDLLICNDSGAMHMAATSGLPTVAAFGPTTLDLGYRPWSARAAVAQIDLACRPCGKHGAERCPLGTHACMEGLPAESVLRGARSVTDDDAGGVAEAGANAEA